MKHVMIVCDYRLDYVGGAQTALIRQAHALQTAGHTVTLIAPGASTVCAGTSMHAVEPQPLAVLPGLDLPLIPAGGNRERWLRRVIQARKPDVIVAHSEFGLAHASARIAGTLRIPFAHTVHTFFWTAPKLAQNSFAAGAVGLFYYWLTGVRLPRTGLAAGPLDSALRNMTLGLARQANVVLSPSTHQAHALRQAGLNHVEYLSNVVEDVLVATPAHYGPTTGPLQLAWVGRFAPEKRLAEATSGVEQAHAHGVRVALRVAGGPGDNSNCVSFVGRLSRPEVGELIASSHAMVLSSVGFDNQPMVVLEGAARGRTTIVLDPVIAREFGAAVIPTPTPDAAGLAWTLQDLCAHPNRLNSANAAALAFAQARTGPQHVRRFMELIFGQH